MSRKMLIDATHEEETRVAVMEGSRLVEYDYESKFRKPLKGSIFLAKVTRVEPSLQAAFVNFGGNRHGFLPFSEIHPDYFRIPIADREALIAEQQAELEAMEAEQEEEAKAEEEAAAQGDESSPALESEGSLDVIDSEEDAFDVQEIGGEPVVTLEEMEAEDPASATETGAEPKNFSENMPEGDMEQDLGADEFSGPQSEEAAADSEGTGQDNNEDGDDDRGRGRNNRFRGRGRGRSRGGRGHNNRRMAHDSRRVESFGGEEGDDGGGGRFRYSLRRKYKIQEVLKRGQIMLVQVSKEERGNKGAAVSTYLSLPGRYCVLMPNSPRAGGVSRKIANYKDRARMRDMMKELEVPQGMSVIVRTAGVARTKPEVKRDLDYLMRLWDTIRELTLQSSAPAMVYEEADLIKRAVRDLYGPEVDEIVVAGEEGYKTAKTFMKMMIPSHVKRVVPYEDQDVPLFHRYKAEAQIAEIGEAHVTLPSGGYLVINPTEALVSIDVNSGKATKERHIEETALKTNLEAASEVARQLRMRDLGGLIVVDFIDMEDRRNNAKVERRMRDSLSGDRARIQMGRISSFGLMELSRQRLNPSLTDSQFELCTHCQGFGRTRTADGTSIMVLRAIEDEAIKGRAAQIVAYVPPNVALYILNNKRKNLTAIETRHNLTVLIRVDDSLGAAGFRVEMSRPAQQSADESDDRDDGGDQETQATGGSTHTGSGSSNEDDSRDGGERNPGRRRGRRGGRRRGGRDRQERGPGAGRHDHGDGPINDLASDEELDQINGNVAEPEFPEDEAEDVFQPGNLREPASQHHSRQRGDRQGGRGRDRRPPRGRDSHNHRRTENRMDNEGADAPAFADMAPPANNTAISVDAPAKPSRPAQERPAQQDRAAFEVVNEAPKEKKRGWWNRMTE